ncbi:MAG: 4-alpha-glucanotransferase, partial [Coprococcus sp.]|nr:4-alpha-glucanotransferase [Coprococcus sp.]
ICRAFIELVMKSKANVCIIPMQDYLGYDDTTRMNQPSTVGKNWRWRMVDKDLSDTLKEEIICYTRKYLR